MKRLKLTISIINYRFLQILTLGLGALRVVQGHLVSNVVLGHMILSCGLGLDDCHIYCHIGFASML